ncbi:MAG: hypothetical protein NC213_09040 [Acetobacter sp.]|nr:hypothetical protein [Bacteroides sp.]MCM1341874.1 hypothetical protein [Acetobacter sp.]MCM1433171.1 hypothetical protein [Clostridiales bacterium]
MTNNTINPEINERINILFETYKNVVSPFIVQLEVMDGEFPTEILNEIRATMTHLAKMNLTESDDVIEDNITKAERHIKRAVLDGFKYCCLSFDDQYNVFNSMYKGTDMSIVDNGEFIANLSKMRKKATESLIIAKSYELEPDSEEELLYEKYEDAYNNYYDLHKYIEDSLDNLEIAKHKSTKDAAIGKWGIVVGVVGAIIGIAGIVINFI